MMLRSARRPICMAVRSCFCFLLWLMTGGCLLGPAPAPTDEPATDPLADVAGSGTARLRGVVQSADADSGFPLGGVRLQVGDAVAFTNVDGTFNVVGAPAGRQRLFVDGSALLTADGHYGQFATTLELGEEEDRAIERPIYLPFVPLATERTVALDAATRVVSREGVTLEIPPGVARREGREYDGAVSVQVVDAERTPIELPERLKGRAHAIITVQPVDVEFAVPVPVSLPLSSPPGAVAPGALGTLWHLDGVGRISAYEGVGRVDDDTFTLLAGGIRSGGWHFVTDLEVAVRRPCAEGRADEARACLAATVSLLEEVQRRAASRVAGARTLLGRLDAALATRGSLDLATGVVRISTPLFPVARDTILEYRAFFRGLESLDEVRNRAAAARAACARADTCNADTDALATLEDRLEQRLDDAGDGATSMAPRFDRLSAAILALNPFYEGRQFLDDDTLLAFDTAAVEYNLAYRGFAPFASPADAFDDVLQAVSDVRQAALALALGRSQAEGRSASSPVRVQRVCDGLGATQVASPEEGFAAVALGDETGQADEGCLLLAVSDAEELASPPIAETQWFEALHPPVLLALTGRIAGRGLATGELAAGTLTRESPVHRWSLPGADRQGIEVAFHADGAALAGLAVDGTVQLARDGGFRVANLPGGSGTSIYICATQVTPETNIVYELGTTLTAERFDFGAAVSGSFDVHTRAAAVLFEAAARDRVIVERRCCDDGAGSFALAVLGPGGAAPAAGLGAGDAPGLRSGAFEVAAGGLYRVVLSPLPGEFADYEIAVRRSAAAPPVPYQPGTEATAAFDEPGASAAFAFAAAAGQVLTLHGVSAVDLDRVAFVITGPDGVAVAPEGLLYFDGSSFAERILTAPLDGAYELVFRVPLEAETTTGSAIIRVDAALPAQGLE
ncbi:MAG: hypothetical protein HY763_03895 [Planctomycetes bacterium]|nr:hypothetical protein [Planctomycetota bacterium]